MKTTQELERIKQELGQKLLIMAHYYQKDEVVEQADLVGDSYKLAVQAARTSAKYIVLCGVYFMAESARILARGDQHVYLPVFQAGCPMADMIDVELFHTHFSHLKSLMGDSLVPIVYVNSTAEVKAAVGTNNGSACTSSNAARICDYFLKQGKKIFFLPDANLGKNVAASLGIRAAELFSYHANEPLPDTPDKTRFITWDGYCHVHTNFSLFDIMKAKANYPYAKILVHPECIPEVVTAADFSGSTSQIMEQVKAAEAGDVLFVGTELHFVERLAHLRSDITVFPLKKSLCGNMAKTNLQNVYQTVREIETEKSTHEIDIIPDIRNNAHRALQNMINISEGKEAVHE